MAQQSRLGAVKEFCLDSSALLTLLLQERGWQAIHRVVTRPDILIVEGLGLTPRPGGLDLLVYLDADEADLEDWFTARFMDFWRAAETDPASFYARFRSMSEPETETFARARVWTQMNLPNLREHIIKARNEADIVVRKLADHSLVLAASSAPL